MGCGRRKNLRPRLMGSVGAQTLPGTRARTRPARVRVGDFQPWRVRSVHPSTSGREHMTITLAATPPAFCVTLSTPRRIYATAAVFSRDQS